MNRDDGQISPQVWARTGGLLYLVIIALGLWGEAVARGSLIVSGDPAATARNILDSEFLWRAGIAGNLVHLMCAVALTLVFYVLMRAVHREIALLAVFFGLVSIATEAAGKLYLLATLFPLGGSDYLAAFTPAQREGLAYLAIRAHGHGFGISLVLFAGFCLSLAWLIWRSGFLPRALGVLMALAGLSYLVNSFALILSPELAGALFPFVLLPAFAGELSLALWLLFKGVDAEKWRARAGA